MLSLFTREAARLCDGVSRREALAIGSLGTMGCSDRSLYTSALLSARKVPARQVAFFGTSDIATPQDMRPHLRYGVSCAHRQRPRVHRLPTPPRDPGQASREPPARCGVQKKG